MTVYNVNLGIGWASSGVEYAQSYRSQAFKELKIPAKFIFSNLILDNNIEGFTKNLGFDDEEIIWLYNFFTDVKIAPSTYKLKDLEKELMQDDQMKKEEGGNTVRFISNGGQRKVIAHLVDSLNQTIDRVEYVVNNQLIMRDLYSYVKYVREYYTGGNSNQVAFREFYNEDGSIAYTQHVDGQQETFEFPDGRVFYSKNDLYAEMIKRLNFGKDDQIILDRLEEDKWLESGQLYFMNHGVAKLFVVVHADHYDKHHTNNQHVLWNNFYEYQFTHSDDVASYIVATDKQNKKLVKQFKKYYHVEPRVDTIPVGNLPKLIKPKEARKPHSLITASRLAGEKHIDLLIKAVAQSKDAIPDITLDIYGDGSEKEHLQQLIDENLATDYIHLKGQYDLTNVYRHYEAYVSASFSEGFGLSLMEAVGSGLAMIGFDVPYGNPTFIDDGKNGHLLDFDEDQPDDIKANRLSEAIVKLFTKDDLNKFSEYSYKIAGDYLLKNVAKRWGKVLGELEND